METLMDNNEHNHCLYYSAIQHESYLLIENWVIILPVKEFLILFSEEVPSLWIKIYNSTSYFLQKSIAKI